MKEQLSHKKKKGIPPVLEINSKDMYINYLTDILKSNGLSYIPFFETTNIDELMTSTCSMYNRIARNKVMYVIEDSNQIVFDDDIEIKEDDEDEEEREITQEEYKYDEPNTKEIENKLEIFVENFRTIRTYKKVLKTLCDNRIKVLSAIYVKSYIDLLIKHTKQILSICADKQFIKKKIAECIELALSALDFRLLAYQSPRCKKDVVELEIQEFVVEKVCNTSLEVEELVYFKTGLEKTQYKGSNLQKIIKNFFNYGSAVFTIKELISIYINAESQIIYLAEADDDKEVETDPFRFYHLSRETNKKRYWEMDCRLDDFVRSIIKNVGTYLVDLFRRIYSDIFTDNIYRENFELGATPIIKNDCEQLLKNLCVLSKYSAISHLIRMHIKSNFVHQETEKDVFVIKSDDILMKKEMKEQHAEVDYSLIMTLFDDLKPDVALNIYTYYA